jgi:acetate kinase
MILVINSGSSSIKFALYKSEGQPEKVMNGQITRIGLPGVEFAYHHAGKSEKPELHPAKNDYPSVVSWLIGWFEKQIDLTQISAIGHRIVHGMQYTEPSIITDDLLKELKRIIPYDPEHLPNEIRLIEAFRQHHATIPQFACFDTAFHQTMPRVAKLLPVPRRFDRVGVHRYGFHGLSYQFLMQALENLAETDVAKGRIILAHLGNGASLAAVKEGKSIDTSMGFTPASGVPMSSRSGDLDPGVAWLMMKTEQLSPDQFNQLVNHESGLLGVSETSGDMGDLLRQEATDTRSAEAVDLFCYQVKKWIGAFAAALGGLDTLVFAGGIGENAPVIRARVCEGLQFLGIELDGDSNGRNDELISTANGRVKVLVIHTDEEWMMAKITQHTLKIFQ